MSAPVVDDSPQRGRARRRSVLTWAALGVAVLLLGLALLGVSGAVKRATPGHLDPDSHGPTGFHAIASVLRDHGVEVEITRSWKDAVARASAGDTTLALTDAPALSDDALTELFAAADRLVLLDPRARTAELAADAIPGARGATAVAAGCSDPAAETAGAVRFGTLFTGGDTECFVQDGGAGLVIAERDGSTRYVVDGTALFTNDTVLDSGAAALGLALLGGEKTLVWYVPTALDGDITGAERTLADFAPDWITPVMVLMLLTGVVAGVWRGRRFGPLVAERLPVTVRVSETLEGRARLYARARDAAHAAVILRRGTARSLARLLGLGSRARVESVVEAASAALSVPTERVARILMGAAPSTDAQLVALSDELRRLEAAVRAAVRSEGNNP